MVFSTVGLVLVDSFLLRYNYYLFSTVFKIITIFFTFVHYVMLMKSKQMKSRFHTYILSKVQVFLNVFVDKKS